MLTARITQLLARLIGMALAAVAAWLGAEQAETAQSIADLAGALAAALVAIGALLVDLLIHRAETGSLLARAGERVARRSSHGTRLPAVLLPLALAGALVTTAGGCAQTPEQRWYQAQDTLSTARKVILAQHEAGNIDDAQLVALDRVEQAARSALNEAVHHLGEADTEADFWLDLAEQALGRLIEHYQQREQRNEPSRVDGPGDTGSRFDQDRPGDRGVPAAAGGRVSGPHRRAA